MLDIERDRELEEDAVVADDRALDAYSTIVTTVAEVVIPSVASLQVSHRLRNGRLAQGAGSAVAITPDGFMVTSAHVVEGTHKGIAAFADGREFARAASVSRSCTWSRTVPPRRPVFDKRTSSCIDETPVEQPGDLQRLMITDRIGRAVCVRLFRNGEIIEVTVHPVELEH
jgi:hypothetical protein